MTDFSLVVPFYNEEANLPEVPRALAAALDEAGVDYELITVDNGSRDGTGALLAGLASQNPRVRPLRVEVNEGYGWGVLNGLRAARGEYVAWMGGDGQIAPADVVRTWQTMVDLAPDLAKVRRVRRGDGWKRILVSQFCNMLFPLLFPVTSRDINGTPKIMRRELCESLDLQSKDWFIDAELMIKLGYRGARILELPVVFLAREKGSSSVRVSSIFEFLANIWRARTQGDLK
jgi:glycosyltransferase involved in cell wall biosynthesis